MRSHFAPHELALELDQARRTRTPITPLTSRFPAMSAAEAYAVQSAFKDLLMAEGDQVVGHKLGLTSTAMQKFLGVDEPDYGPILSTMVASEGDSLPLSNYIQPRVEAEIAIVLGSELKGPGVTLRDAQQAVAGAIAAIEVVDSRIANWEIKLADTVCDLASTATTVLSPTTVAVDGWDPRLLGMLIAKNGSVLETGAGAAAMGNPLIAVAWLANTLAAFGQHLESGHFVMTGALHTAFPVEPGDHVVAEFDRLGAVSARFE